MNQLVEIRQIEELKARYFRGLDTNDWELFAATMRPECSAQYAGGQHSFNDRDEIVKFMSDNLTGDNLLTMHQGHTSEIEFFGDVRASGIWYLQDTVLNISAATRIYGAGIYHDEYQKVNGQWLISKTGYDRTFECVEPLDSKHKVLQNMFSD